MTYTVSGTSKENLTKKVDIAKKMFLNAVNETLKYNGWQFICEESTEKIVDRAKKSSDALYNATLHFVEKPLFEYNYHGLPKVSKAR